MKKPFEDVALVGMACSARNLSVLTNVPTDLSNDEIGKIIEKCHQHLSAICVPEMSDKVSMIVLGATMWEIKRRYEERKASRVLIRRRHNQMEYAIVAHGKELDREYWVLSSTAPENAESFNNVIAVIDSHGGYMIDADTGKRLEGCEILPLP